VNYQEKKKGGRKFHQLKKRERRYTGNGYSMREESDFRLSYPIRKKTPLIHPANGKRPIGVFELASESGGGGSVLRGCGT